MSSWFFIFLVAIFERLEPAESPSYSLHQSGWFCDLCDAWVIKLIPSIVCNVRTNEGVIVAGIDCAPVNQYWEQAIAIGNLLRLNIAFLWFTLFRWFWAYPIGLTLAALILFYWNQWFKIKNIIEFELLVILFHHLWRLIVLISIQGYLKHGRKLNKPDELSGILFAIWTSLVLVISREIFNSNILSNTIFDCIISFDTKLKSIEYFFSSRLKIYIDTFNNILDFAFKERFISSLNFRTLHLWFKLITESTIEFINILLLIPLMAIPSKRLKKFMSAHGRLYPASQLEVIKYPL